MEGTEGELKWGEETEEIKYEYQANDSVEKIR